MEQINLLRQKTTDQSKLRALPSLFAKFLIAVAVAVVVYYGWLVYQEKKVAKEVLSAKAQTIETKKQALEKQGRQELLTRQAQLKEYGSLVSEHTYFSQLFQPLANITLKSANYLVLRARSTGEISLTGQVPNVKELDKFMQIFNLSEFNKNFSNVKIAGFSRVQEKDTSYYRFELTMNFASQLIKNQK